MVQCVATTITVPTRVVDVKAGERVLYDVLGVRAVQFLSKEGQEHGEIDRPRGLGGHLLQVLVGRVLAQWRHHFQEVVFVNIAVSILVDHVESLLL